MSMDTRLMNDDELSRYIQGCIDASGEYDERERLRIERENEADLRARVHARLNPPAPRGEHGGRWGEP